jgi:hypothetical protein
MTDAPTSTRSSPLTRSGAPAGRLAVLAFFGMAAGALPLPLLPPRLLSRVRGAVVHDVAARRGLSLTHEARRELARASVAVSGGALLAGLVFLASRSLRRIGPVGIVPPIAAWIEVYALGLLLDRYFERSRASATVRVDEREARRIRSLVDKAVKRAFSPRLRALSADPDPAPIEDLRDMPTRVTDGLLLAAAGLPTFLRRRLEAAFDEIAGAQSSSGNGAAETERA